MNSPAMATLALTAVLGCGAAHAQTAPQPSTQPATKAATQMTRDNGAPVGDNQNSQTAGPNGPVLLLSLIHI